MDMNPKHADLSSMDDEEEEIYFIMCRQLVRTRNELFETQKERKSRITRKIKDRAATSSYQQVCLICSSVFPNLFKFSYTGLRSLIDLIDSCFVATDGIPDGFALCWTRI